MTFGRYCHFKPLYPIHLDAKLGNNKYKPCYVIICNCNGQQSKPKEPKISNDLEI